MKTPAITGSARGSKRGGSFMVSSIITLEKTRVIAAATPSLDCHTELSVAVVPYNMLGTLV